MDQLLIYIGVLEQEQREVLFSYKDEKGNSLSHIFLVVGSSKAKECFIECGAKLDEKNGNNDTPITLCLKLGKPQLAGWMVEQFKGEFELAPLHDTLLYVLKRHRVIDHGDVPSFILKYVKMKGVEDVINYPDAEGKTLLYYALASNSPYIVALLLTKKAALQKQDAEICVKFINCAVTHNANKVFVKILPTLLQQLKSFDYNVVNTKDKDGNALIHKTINKCNQKYIYDVIKIFIEFGANVNQNDWFSQTTLELAMDRGSNVIILLGLFASKKIINEIIEKWEENAGASASSLCKTLKQALEIKKALENICIKTIGKDVYLGAIAIAVNSIEFPNIFKDSYALKVRFVIDAVANNCTGLEVYELCGAPIPEIKYTQDNSPLIATLPLEMLFYMFAFLDSRALVNFTNTSIQMNTSVEAYQLQWPANKVPKAMWLLDILKEELIWEQKNGAALIPHKSGKEEQTPTAQDTCIHSVEVQTLQDKKPEEEAAKKAYYDAKRVEWAKRLEEQGKERGGV